VSPIRNPRKNIWMIPFIDLPQCFREKYRNHDLILGHDMIQPVLI
jgi:hypothetical protein